MPVTHSENDIQFIYSAVGYLAVGLSKTKQLSLPVDSVLLLTLCALSIEREKYSY